MREKGEKEAMKGEKVDLKYLKIIIKLSISFMDMILA